MADVSRFPPTWNPESPGSRFTTRVSLAILTRSAGASRFSQGDDSGPTQEVITDALDGPPSSIEGLGDSRTVDGAYGRGAAGWVPVVEWAAQAMVAGVVGNAAWAAITASAMRVRALVDELSSRQVEFLVSRGTAALIAIDHVLRTDGESQVLDVEAVEEPSALAGAEPSELNFVGIEPWLVSLINADRSTRYVIAVDPSGRIQGTLALAMSESEGLYSPLQRERNDLSDADAHRWQTLPALEADAALEAGIDELGVTPRDEIDLGVREVVDGLLSVLRGARGAIRGRMNERR